MKEIVVTERNLRSIYNKLNKFFFNEEKTGFLCWHNFDCGCQNIEPYRQMEKKLIAAPLNIEIVNDPMIRKSKFIRITFGCSSGAAILPGDTLVIMENKVIVKSQWEFDCYNFCYSVYVPSVMSEEQKKAYYENLEVLSEKYKNDLKLWDISICAGGKWI